MAGVRRNSVVTVLLNSTEALVKGLSELIWKPGTLGITKTRTRATLCSGETKSDNEMNQRCTTYAMHRRNINQAKNFLVKYLPHKPRSPRLHSFHFCALRSLTTSRLPRFVIPRSSSAFHSGPNAGTVTISTGTVLAVSDSILNPGEWTGRYLDAWSVFSAS